MITPPVDALKNTLTILAALLVICTARADFAITNTISEGVGYINGAAGFSFTPTTNLAVTSVGYLNSGLANPIIRFWSDTNFPIATFPLAASTSNNVTVYSNATITLLAGRRYTISVQNGPLLSSSTVLIDFHNTNQFRPAAGLTNFVATAIFTNGLFGGFVTNYYYRGPNFTFQVQTDPLDAPPLNILRGPGDTAVLAWPASPGGWVLQQQTDLGNSNWPYLADAPGMVAGSNQVTIPVLATNRYFRLYHP